ncbi:unnamed protein product [Cylindrotheca closterium]|uniref:Uncharacterized protein n=1 Tax=Cylindrotheca closterium TaxID=2856 RepID=A0AAD2FV91_9STRA|nr:unnamed protein product [Cylindrotheca closterium]
MRQFSMRIAALPASISLLATILSFECNHVLAQPNLQDYILNAPACSISQEDLNVHCDFSNIEPLDGNIAHFITGFDNCQGSAARDSELSLSAATGTAVSGGYSVIVDINTDFNLTNGESETFTFCLLTHLRDASNNLMIYQGEKINSTFTSDGEFTVSDLDTETFDGVNVDVNSDTKIFAVTAYRCDLSRNQITTPPVAVGVTLLICIDTGDTKVVISAVNGFYGVKTNVAQTDLLAGNTEVLGLSTDTVTIGTRPFVKFFEDTDLLEVLGTVSLDIGDSGASRQLRMRKLQVGGKEDTFDVKVEVETQREASVAARHACATTGMVGVFLTAMTISFA